MRECKREREREDQITHPFSQTHQTHLQQYVVSDLLINQPPDSLSLSLSQRNSLDLDGNTLGKFLDSHARASRFVRTKVFFIDGVLHNHIIITCQQKNRKKKKEKEKEKKKSKLTISPKFAISVINTVTLVTLANPLPAASRIFTSPSIHAVVCSAILPVTSVPSARAGICPETKMSPAAWMAWDL